MKVFEVESTDRLTSDNAEPHRRSRLSPLKFFRKLSPGKRAKTFRETSSSLPSHVSRSAGTWGGGTDRTDPNESDATAGARELRPTEDARNEPLESDDPRTIQIQDLVHDVVTVMEKYKIGLQESAENSYLPDDERQRLVTPEAIRNTLGTDSEDLVDWIWAEASKTFVIMILAIPERARRLEAMQTFREHRFRDVSLPVTNLLKHCDFDWNRSERTKCEPGCHQQVLRKCKGVHRRRFDCFHHSAWTITSFRSFYKEQWGLLLQPFYTKVTKGPNGEDQHHLPILQIEHDRILPFLPSEQFKEKVEGYFGIVQPARMLKDFQNTISNPGHQTIDIAIKTMQTIKDKEDFNIEREWRRESDAHKALGDLDRDHLVQAVAAYQHRGQYCLIFEWANGGSLRSYWKNAEHPGLSADMIREYLEQLRGLTSALQMMHHTKQARALHRRRSATVNSVDSDSSSSAGLRRNTTATSEAVDLSDYTEDENNLTQKMTRQSSVPQIVEPSMELPESSEVKPSGKSRRPSSPNSRGDENWRHGDIKPENILRFVNTSSGLGVLKLADLGRAKQHFLVTRNRAVLEKDPWRTKPYEPPDLYLDDSAKNMSRLFDVWSLGCVFFECIVWMLYGYEWLRDFKFTTSAPHQHQTPFWIRRSKNSADINPIVADCMKFLFEHDPECSGNTSSAIRDLLSLVRDKMLVVDLPARTDAYSKGKRANTETILEDLNRIIQKSERHDYLFTGNDRFNLRELPKPQVEILPSTSLDAKAAINTSLAVPGALSNGRSRTSLLNTYSNALENKWRYVNDDEFAMSVYQRNRGLYESRYLVLENQVLCRVCRRLDFRQKGLSLTRKVSELGSQNFCSLCKILLARTSAAGLKSVATITLYKMDAGWAIHSGEAKIDRNPHMRLCRSIADGAILTGQTTSFIPLGLPRLPEILSDASVGLLRSWLEDCDRGHGNHHLDCVSYMKNFRPKRLLDVGLAIDGDHSYIVETSTLPATDDIRYLALSHPWGESSKSNRHLVSNIDNIAQHMKKIADDELPKNFSDAVTVARHLEIQYIWIDALCILQKTKSHPGDFQEEASSMQDIFSSAYCVLAASSASGMNSGFLRFGHESSRPSRQAAEVNAGDSDDNLMLCDTPDDFQRDVIDGPLSARAWVLQERALARRTIFFTDNQIYWECSNGVRCESMSRLRNTGAALLGDSNFPAYVVSEQMTRGSQIYLFEGLYADYCRLNFSRSTDKPFAIAGLEQRLSQQFDDISVAGVFGQRRGRCLLWMRADGEKSLRRIDFRNANAGTHKPPSWSFMAYMGGITYLEIPAGVKWQNLDLKLTGTVERSWLYAKVPPSFHAYALDFEVKGQPDGDQWLLVYDDPTCERYNHKCVIIGKIGEELNYVLIVRPIVGSTNGTEKATYERVGAGFLPKDWLHGETIAIQIL